MKKIILGLLILGAFLSADKLYLADGREMSGNLAVYNGSFAVLGQGQEVDLLFHANAVDAVEKDGVKYTPQQYINTFAPKKQAAGLNDLTISDRIKLYELEKSDKYEAVSLAMTFPMLGHNYAGDGARGFAIFIGKFIVPFMTAGLVPVDPMAKDGGQEQKNMQIGVGVLTFALMQFWEIVDSMGAVEDKNNELKERLGIAY